MDPGIIPPPCWSGFAGDSATGLPAGFPPDELHSVAISGSVAHDPANPNREPGEGWCELDSNFPSHFQLDPGGHSHAAFVEFVSAAIVKLGPFRTLDNDPDEDIKSMARPTPGVEQGARFYRLTGGRDRTLD